MRKTISLLALALLLAGCVVQADEKGLPLRPTEAGVSPVVTELPTSAPVSGGAFPTISTSASPTNPDRRQPVVLTVSAQDDVGLASISWESGDDFSLEPESRSFDCGGETSCSVRWEFAFGVEGEKAIAVKATDVAGQSSPFSIKLSVRPFDFKARPTATPTPSTPFCGNSACDASEAFETCPGDCPFEGFACANSRCEGGESFQSCPQDCSVSDAVGSTCGDGACEPGEDAANCASDCTPIRPNCGNNVCDAWETTSGCSADCAQLPEGCDFDEDCGYKQVCSGGECVDVDCTNDAQCGYGKECESNRCVRCPSGPYGPAC